jgi:hypothetical protein
MGMDMEHAQSEGKDIEDMQLDDKDIDVYTEGTESGNDDTDTDMSSKHGSEMHTATAGSDHVWNPTGDMNRGYLSGEDDNGDDGEEEEVLVGQFPELFDSINLDDNDGPLFAFD